MQQALWQHAQCGNSVRGWPIRACCHRGLQADAPACCHGCLLWDCQVGVWPQDSCLCILQTGVVQHTQGYIEILTLSSLSAFRYSCILLRALESDSLVSVPMNFSSAVVSRIDCLSLSLIHHPCGFRRQTTSYKKLVQPDQELLNFPSLKQGLHEILANFTDSQVMLDMAHQVCSSPFEVKK